MRARHRIERNTRRRALSTRVMQVAGVSIALIGLAVARHPKSLAARNAEPTFAEDVAPILYKNCTTCHRPGGLGPFSLLDYDSAKVNIDDMRDAVADNIMPPWQAAGPQYPGAVRWRQGLLSQHLSPERVGACAVHA